MPRKDKDSEKEKNHLDEGIVGEIVADEPTEAEEIENEVDTLIRFNAIYMDKIKSLAAEFENFRNRTAKEMGQVRDRAAREVIIEMLPIIDNFDRALKNADITDGFAAGMLMIQNQLSALLEKLGVTKIETIGQAFDIKYHAAVSHIKDENLGENIVAEELQAGYIHKDVVIRHATVVVAN